jgi:hypothetical protein
MEDAMAQVHFPSIRDPEAMPTEEDLRLVMLWKDSDGDQVEKLYRHVNGSWAGLQEIARSQSNSEGRVQWDGEWARSLWALERLLTARVAEKSALLYLQREFRSPQPAPEGERYEVLDHSIRQLRSGEKPQPYDLEIRTIGTGQAAPLYLDVKNVRLPRERWDAPGFAAAAQPEYIVQKGREKAPKKIRFLATRAQRVNASQLIVPAREASSTHPFSNGESHLQEGITVEIVGTIAAATVAGLAQRFPFDNYLRLDFDWLDTARGGQENEGARRNTARQLLPIWMFDVPMFAPFQAELSRTRSALEGAARALQPGDERYLSGAPLSPGLRLHLGLPVSHPEEIGAWGDEFISHLERLRRSKTGRLPELYLLVLGYFLKMAAEKEARERLGFCPTGLRTILFPTEAYRRAPLGIPDPGETVWALVGDLVRLKDYMDRLSEFRDFRFHAEGRLSAIWTEDEERPGVRRPMRPRRRTLLFPYCGAGRYHPGLAAWSHPSCDRCGRLICTHKPDYGTRCDSCGVPPRGDWDDESGRSGGGGFPVGCVENGIAPEQRSSVSWLLTEAPATDVERSPAPEVEEPLPF